MKKVCDKCTYYAKGTCHRYPAYAFIKNNLQPCGEFTRGFREKFNYTVGIVVLIGWSFYILAKGFDYGWFS